MTVPPKATRAPGDFSRFFSASFGTVARSVERIAGPAAEDVTQEAFIAALQQWDHVATLDAPDAWVAHVARRLAWRRRGRERDRPNRETAASGSTDFTLAADPVPDLPVDLDRAMRGLSERERTCIRLYHLAGLSIGDVAALLEMSESATKMALLRARERLADVLIGHRGSWAAERTWRRDAIARDLRNSDARSHVDGVMAGIPMDGFRWTVTFGRGAYAIEIDDGYRLDFGTYRVKHGDLVLRPWIGDGTVLLRPGIDGGQARFRVLSDTTPPTHGVPDEIWLALLLESTVFDRERSHDPLR